MDQGKLTQQQQRLYAFPGIMSHSPYIIGAGGGQCMCMCVMLVSVMCMCVMLVYVHVCYVSERSAHQMCVGLCVLPRSSSDVGAAEGERGQWCYRWWWCVNALWFFKEECPA